MRIASIVQDDMANGPGLRTSIFVSGCTHQCSGCHNPELWDFTVGNVIAADFAEKICLLLDENGISRNLSILGGEPLHEENIDELTEICKKIKDLRSNTNIWVWTGYTLQEKKFCDIINYIDVIIDGKFEKENLSGYHPWRGSSNQKIYQKEILSSGKINWKTI